MKPLLWDSINPFTGQPWTWDDPNARWDFYLEPGDPGFVPYPGMTPPAAPKKKRPFRHAPKPQTNANPDPNPPLTTMSTFKYNIAPKASGGFTTRAVRNAPVADSTLLGLIATQAAITPEQTEAALRAFAKVALDCSSGSVWSPNFLGLYSFRPTSGGSSATPDGFHNAADINADVSLSFTPDAIATWQSQLTLESQGEVGKITPAIDSIIRQSDSATDKYTPGGLLQIRGDHLNLKPSELTQGVFFQPASGAEVRVTEYAAIKPQSIIVLVPSGLSGPLTVRVATFINGSVRSDTYTTAITQ